MDPTPTPCPCGCGALLPAHRVAGPVPVIVVLSRMRGAGKSTVARILAGRFERGVHVDLDLVPHHYPVMRAELADEGVRLDTAGPTPVQTADRVLAILGVP